jgi:hypothetical protein
MPELFILKKKHNTPLKPNNFAQITKWSAWPRQWCIVQLPLTSYFIYSDVSHDLAQGLHKSWTPGVYGWKDSINWGY